MAELAICLSQEILGYPRAFKAALTDHLRDATTGLMLKALWSPREVHLASLTVLVGSNCSCHQTSKSGQVVWDQSPKDRL